MSNRSWRVPLFCAAVPEELLLRTGNRLDNAALLACSSVRSLSPLLCNVCQLSLQLPHSSRQLLLLQHVGCCCKLITCLCMRQQYRKVMIQLDILPGCDSSLLSQGPRLQPWLHLKIAEQRTQTWAVNDTHVACLGGRGCVRQLLRRKQTHGAACGAMEDLPLLDGRQQALVEPRTAGDP